MLSLAGRMRQRMVTTGGIGGGREMCEMETGVQMDFGSLDDGARGKD